MKKASPTEPTETPRPLTDAYVEIAVEAESCEGCGAEGPMFKDPYDPRGAGVRCAKCRRADDEDRQRWLSLFLQESGLADAIEERIEHGHGPICFESPAIGGRTCSCGHDALVKAYERAARALAFHAVLP